MNLSPQGRGRREAPDEGENPLPPSGRGWPAPAGRVRVPGLESRKRRGVGPLTRCLRRHPPRWGEGSAHRQRSEICACRSAKAGEGAGSALPCEAWGGWGAWHHHQSLRRNCLGATSQFDANSIWQIGVCQLTGAVSARSIGAIPIILKRNGGGKLDGPDGRPAGPRPSGRMGRS